ncbi:MAG: hypothetical protein SGJ24_04820 [Chloroflexota bacterium]|nr:hypothetical protein [Chloroflexota bacterium]
MSATTQPNLQLLYNDARLTTLFDALDELHSASADGNLRAVTPLSNTEMIAWLQDLVYIAQETIVEIREQNADSTQGIQLVRKTS